MNKPIIIFYEPHEIMIKINEDKIIYLDETFITLNELLEKYLIDYDSFFQSNVRDEKGYPEILKSKSDVNEFLLNYINN
jgi:hypothetical protein